MKDHRLCTVVEAIILGLFIIAVVAGTGSIKHLRQQAVERGYAIHNSQTGNWEWVEPEVLP